MEGFGADRALSATAWRVVLPAACGMLIVGLGLGILIGRMTAPPAEPPPASAAILPDLPPVVETAAAAPSDDDAEAAPPPPVAAPMPVPAPPAPVAVKAAAPLIPIERKPVAVAVAPRAEAKPVPKPDAKSTRAKRAAGPAPPAHGPRWIVQLGAFQSSDHADLLVNTLATHGQAARVRFTRDAAGQGWFYVQTLPYRSVSSAKSAAKSLAAREHLPTYLIKLPPVGG